MVAFTIKSTIKVLKKSTKICFVFLTKTSKQHDRYCCGIPVVKLIFACLVLIQVLFKHVTIRKEVYNKWKSGKIPEVNSEPRNRS